MKQSLQNFVAQTSRDGRGQDPWNLRYFNADARVLKNMKHLFINEKHVFFHGISDNVASTVKAFTLRPNISEVTCNFPRPANYGRRFDCLPMRFLQILCFGPGPRLGDWMAPPKVPLNVLVTIVNMFPCWMQLDFAGVGVDSATLRIIINL